MPDMSQLDPIVVQEWSVRMMACLKGSYGPDIEAASRFLLGLPVSRSMRMALVYQLPVGEGLQNELLHAYYIKERVAPLPPQYQALCAAPIPISNCEIAYSWPGSRYKANSRPSWSFKAIPAPESLLSDASEEALRQCLLFFDPTAAGLLHSDDFLRKLSTALGGATVDGFTCDQEELRELVGCAEHPPGSGRISIRDFLARY